MTASRGTAAGLARAGAVVSGAFLASRILGYVRTVVIGTTFGAGPELDAFFAAFRLPDLIFQLVAAGAMSSALIPVLAGLFATDESARAWRLVATVANLVLIVLTGLAILAFALAPVLVRFLAPGFDDVGLARTTELTRIMLIAPVLLALGAVATSALNAAGRFAASAMAPIAYNVAIIAGAVLLGPSIGVHALAVGTVVGAFGHVAIQVLPLRSAGFRPSRSIELSDPAARRVLTLLAPRAIGLGASQITFIVMTALASSLGDGAVTAYAIAFALLQIPLGVIGVPLGVVIFPSMAREVALGSTAAYVGLVTRSVRVLLFVMLPITALGIALRFQVVELLFGYGRFDAAAIADTAATLAAFLAGLGAHAAIAVLARAFYARQDTRTPVLAAVVAVVVNTALGVVLVGPFGLVGLALAIAVAAWIEAAMLLVLLERHEGAFAIGPVLRGLVESGVGAAAAGLIAGLVVAWLGASVGPSAPKLVILLGAAAATSAGALAYAGYALALRIPELASIVGLVTEFAGRRGRT